MNALELISYRDSWYSRSKLSVKFADTALAVALAIGFSGSPLALLALLELVKSLSAFGFRRTAYWVAIPVATSSLMLLMTWLWYGAERAVDVGIRLVVITLAVGVMASSVSPLEVSVGLSRLGATPLGDAIELGMRSLLVTVREAQDINGVMKLHRGGKSVLSRSVAALVASSLVRTQSLAEYYVARYYGRKKGDYPLERGWSALVPLVAKLLLLWSVYTSMTPLSIVLT